LQDKTANALLPWSASRNFHLSNFDSSAFEGPVAIVGFMDFLKGIAVAGKIDFFDSGNGRVTTDYSAKGTTVVRLLKNGYALVICHINAPDEAAHMNDLYGKIKSIEQIDQHIVTPIIEYFQQFPDELGGVLILPDHYSNIRSGAFARRRGDIHSTEPVPFACWNNLHKDSCINFNEEAAKNGRYGSQDLSHLQLLPILLDSFN
jgi:2,3-bisphosphoglycerate-independent phosphoglycerate mutase